MLATPLYHFEDFYCREVSGAVDDVGADWASLAKQARVQL